MDPTAPAAAAAHHAPRPARHRTTGAARNTRGRPWPLSCTPAGRAVLTAHAPTNHPASRILIAATPRTEAIDTGQPGPRVDQHDEPETEE